MNHFDFDQSCARIHELLAGSPLAGEFALIQEFAEAWRLFIDAELSDFEHEVIGEVEERAGILWLCRATAPDGPDAEPADAWDECGALNFFADARCFDCGAERPASEEVAT